MSIEYCICLAAFTIAGYLAGGVMYCRLLPKLFYGVDISEVSSDGNPGAANVFIHCGKGLGIICVILDLAKGFLPVFIAVNTLGYDEVLFALVMAAPVLGHATAPFDGWRGGKCISTSFGVLLGLVPHSEIVLILAALYILLSTILKIPKRRIRSIVTFSLFAAISSAVLFVQKKYGIMLGCIAISLAVIIKHNIMPDKTCDKVSREIAA